MRSRIFRFVLSVALLGSSTLGAFFSQPAVSHAFDTSTTNFYATNSQNNVISDGAFTDINSMSAVEIQLFLQAKGSFLQSFSENGRSAAQIIYDAAHGYGDASGTYTTIAINTQTGTVSPEVILATLQKEQSLITMTTRNDAALQAAMGFACPDTGGCNASYAGFTKQVENAAWQLRYNYEGAKQPASWRIANYGSDNNFYHVGQTITVNDSDGAHQITLTNAATAALYRYTPHVNYSFWRITNTWFSMPLVNADYVTQTPWDSQYNVNVAFSPGETKAASVTLFNSGSTTWNQTGANPVHLGVTNDRHSQFLTASSFDTTRAAFLTQTSIPSGTNGDFQFNLTAPSQPGTYYEYFQAVMEGVAWFGPVVQFQIKVLAPDGSYVTQSPWNQQYSANFIGGSGETQTASVSIKNTGAATWYRNGQNAVHLGVTNDRHSSFLSQGAFDTNRAGYLDQTSVAPGATGTFTFPLTANVSPGTYQEYFQAVMEGVTWFGPVVQFQIRVFNPDASYVTQTPWDATQNVNVAFHPGQSADVSVTLKNTSIGSWQQGGSYAVHLGVLGDKHSQFIHTPGFDSNRAAKMNESSVPTGQTATFQFTLYAPTQTGTYYEYFQPVMEGVTWFGPVVQFQIKVT